jgi:hypothetical protein
VHQQLAQAEEEARRLVKAVAAGALVDELTEAMREVEARRKRLREELEAETSDGGEALDMIPGLVQRAVADLGIMLEGGQTQAVRRAVSRVITRIEVKGAEVPERKLLEPRLYLHGNLPGLLTLATEESTKLVAGAGFGPDWHSERLPLVAARRVYAPARQGARGMRRRMPRPHLSMVRPSQSGGGNWSHEQTPSACGRGYGVWG